MCKFLDPLLIETLCYSGRTNESHHGKGKTYATEKSGLRNVCMLYSIGLVKLLKINTV